jgi:hypothetical protein
MSAADHGVSVSELVQPAPLSVQAAISKVMQDMPAIGKDSKAPASMGGYPFRGVEAITQAAQPLMARVGLVIIPQAQTAVINSAPGQKEAWQDVMVKFEWLVVGPDGSSFTASTYGIGRDHTDKGATKAHTQAYKYLLLTLLCISDAVSDGDGHDYSHSEQTPEEKAAEVRSDRATAAQKKLKALSDDDKQTMRDGVQAEFNRALVPAELATDEKLLVYVELCLP